MRITYHTRQDMLSEGVVLLLQEMFLSYDLDKGKGLHDYFYEHAFLRNTLQSVSGT